MKPCLEALHQAGIHRAGFSAYVQVVDKKRGHVGLQQIQTPIGDIDHAWIPYFHRGSWLPVPGEQVEFTARIEEYHHTDGSTDIGLFAVKVIA
jgi:hypothetical protein